MKSGATTSQAGRSSNPQPTVSRRTVLVAAVVLGLVVAGFFHVAHGGDVGLKLCAKNGWALGDTFVDLDDYGDRLLSNRDHPKVLEAMFECGALRRPVHEDAAQSREVSRQQGSSPREQSRVARPELPPAQPAEPAPAAPSSMGSVMFEAKRKLKLTQIKVQKYVHEAYPAWLQAHPGQACPHQLIELNEYMEDQDANDAWGRPLKMFCYAARSVGAKRIKVISLGRDAEKGTEDDITAEE
jgi:hypothetical protein